MPLARRGVLSWDRWVAIKFYTNPARERISPFPAQRANVGTLRALIRAAGLSVDEFLSLL